MSYHMEAVLHILLESLVQEILLVVLTLGRGKAEVEEQHPGLQEPHTRLWRRLH